jgi:hypothetical protein
MRAHENFTVNIRTAETAIGVRLDIIFFAARADQAERLLKEEGEYTSQRPEEQAQDKAFEPLPFPFAKTASDNAADQANPDNKKPLHKTLLLH